MSVIFCVPLLKRGSVRVAGLLWPPHFGTNVIFGESMVGAEIIAAVITSEWKIVCILFAVMALHESECSYLKMDADSTLFESILYLRGSLLNYRINIPQI
jgi:hypothetical protein